MRVFFLNSFFLIAQILLSQNPFETVRQNMSNGDLKRNFVLLDSCFNKGYCKDSVLFYKGLTYIKDGNVNECERFCDILSKNYPAFSEVHYLKGLLYFQQEYYGKSANEFTKAIKNNPKDLKALYNRSITLGMMENYLDAIDDLTSCLQLNPTYSQAYYSRAYWYEYTGNYPEATKDYTETIRLDPKNFDAYLGLAFIYQAQREPLKACEIIGKAINAGSQIAEEVKESFCH